METIFLDFSIHRRKMFKSYYVVWKRRTVVRFTFANSLFKSYYVVWKLCMEQLTRQTRKKFKSYYVVWKLLWFFHIPSIVVRLNRTM